MTTNWQAHEILVLNAYAQKPPFNVHADVPSGVRCLMFDMSLPPKPYVTYASSEASDESALMRRLV